MTTQKVSIRYLIDVAIGSPEPGIVNFNALYTVLHVISEKLALHDEHIEIDSSFCPVSTNVIDSKSNVSSERLVDYQIFDYPSPHELVDETLISKKIKEKQATKEKFVSESIKSGQNAQQQRQPADYRKVVFEAPQNKDTTETLSLSKMKETERMNSYRSELKQHIDALNARLDKIEKNFISSVLADQKVECLRETITDFQSKLDNLRESVDQLKQIKTKQDEDMLACRKKLEHDKLAIIITEVQHDLTEMKAAIANNTKKVKETNKPILADQHDLENHLREDYSNIQLQILELKTICCNLTEQMTNIEQNMPQNKRYSSVVMLNAFQQQVASLKDAIETASIDLNLLRMDYDGQKSTITELTTKLDDLTRIKIDKEEIDELLSEKADYTMLQRKVSVENMEADRRKLEKQISEITDCFVLNEERTQKQISEIRKFLGDQSLEDMLYVFKSKVDKEIQVVRDAIKKLADIKPDVDAAAARLKNLACLSCDQDVVMRAIELNITKLEDAYASKTLSPIIVFEMEKVRQAAKFGIPITTEPDAEFPKSIRHSGGAHTIITAKDRVSKTRSRKSKEEQK